MRTKILLKKKQLELIEKEKVEIIEKNIESSNIIEDVSYSAKDEKGNEYFLKAGEVQLTKIIVILFF